jgi:hypothetical protein
MMRADAVVAPASTVSTVPRDREATREGCSREERDNVVSVTNKRTVLLIASIMSLGTSACNERVEQDAARAPVPVQTNRGDLGPSPKTLPTGLVLDREGFGTLLAAPASVYSPSAEGPSPPRAMVLSPDPAIPPEIQRLVRIFPRLSPPDVTAELVTKNAVEPPQQTATIIMRRGCLRLKEQEEPLALFGPGVRLFVAADGYLTLGNPAGPAPQNARVGEALYWTGDRKVVTAHHLTLPIQRQCGRGTVVFVGGTASVSAGRAAADGLAARRLQQMYGTPWGNALEQVRACRVRLERSWRQEISGKVLPIWIENLCGSTPPPLVTDPDSCPSGTSHSGGLCRTAEGYIRPLPKM